MATPRTRPAPTPEARAEPTPPTPETDARERLRRRVQDQRRHIQVLTGQDPLRGGVDD